MSTLYVVATPIGNLSDLTARAIEILSSVPVVAAEDTRVARKLLNHIGASPRLESLHEHTSPDRLRGIVEILESIDMAFITDAGTPGISDPGAALVSEAVASGIRVVPLPGPSALSTALSVTGWAFTRFLFLGFLPRERNERGTSLNGVVDEPGPIVIYESPHRVKATLTDIHKVFPDRQLVICRELTKLYEEIFRGTASRAALHFAEPRGEFVILIPGIGERPEEAVSDDRIAESLRDLSSQGLKGRSLVDRAVELTGAPKNRVYRLSLNSD